MSGIGISPCPTFQRYPNNIAPSILFDGNTVAWFKLNTVVKDGANRVSQWSDVSGNNNHLLQAIAANQPLWSVDGILFDGVNDYMACVPFAFIQPEFIYVVGKQVTWTANDHLIDGNAVNTMVLQQFTGSPGIRIYGGASLATNVNWILNTLSILRILFNGAASSIQINLNPSLIGNGGASNGNGFIIGTNTILTSFSNIETKEIILRRIADNILDQTTIYNYLKIANNVP